MNNIEKLGNVLRRKDPVKFADPIRILLIDNHKTVRAGLRSFLEERPGFKVTAEVSFSSEAVKLAQAIRPDIAVLNVDRDDAVRRALLEQLLTSCRNIRLLLLATDDDLAFCLWALQLGTAGVVLKDQDGTLLHKAIECVCAGEIWAERGITASLLHQVNRSKKKSPEAINIETVTDREREVIELVGEGLKNRQIGERMFISETTVRHHLTSIFGKLGVSDRLSLVIYAYRYGLVRLPSQELR
jgi:two-component system response regulator DegU